MNRTLHRLLLTSSLVLVSVSAGLLLTEVAYRAARRFVCVGKSVGPVYEPHALYGWAHRPHAQWMMYSCVGRRFEWRTDVRINSLGLRDREYPYAKPPGTRRILLLGDSMTEAVQVPLETTFAKQLEANLRREGLEAEVLNTGVAAYGTDNELLFFREEGQRYHPDLVLLMLNPDNDIAENSEELNAEQYARFPDLRNPKPYFQLEGGGNLTLDLQSFRRRMAERSSDSWVWDRIEASLYLLRLLHRVLLAARVAVPESAAYPLTFDTYAVPVSAEWEKAWQITFALIRKLRREVDAAGARFAVAVLPGRDVVSPRAWDGYRVAFPALAGRTFDLERPARRMMTFLAEEGIPALDLLPPLRTAFEKTGMSGFYGFDTHLDAHGHAVVATTLFEFVRQQLEHTEPPDEPDRSRHDGTAPR